MTGAILEYARGLAVVKSFGRDIPLEHFDIAFDHVSFGYDDRQVLRDVSFTIPEKTSTAIVGPSGSGYVISYRFGPIWFNELYN